MLRYSNTLSISLLLLASIACTGCVASETIPLDTQEPAVRLIAPDGSSMAVTVEIADDPQARMQGLMHRTFLPENHAMLFVFPVEQPMAFWMKNTLIPLDVVYFDQESRYVSHAVMQPCTADPCPSYPADGPARYALEFNAGFVREHGIGSGWQLSLLHIDADTAS